MKWKNIFIATAILAVLVIYMKLSKKERGEEEKERILTFSKETVNRFDLSWGKEHVVCSKSAEGIWGLEQPLVARASEKEIDGILRELEDAQIDQTIDVAQEKVGLADYGLDAPQLSLALQSTEGSFDLQLGKKDPEGSKIYVMRQEKGAESAKTGQNADQARVLIVNASLLGRLQKNAFDLRDKSLVRFDKSLVNKVSVTCPKGVFVCEKRDDNQWHLSSPIETLADKTEMESIINDLEAIQVRKFLDPALHDVSVSGPADVEASVWVKGSEAPQTLFLGPSNQEDAGVCQAWGQEGTGICLVDSVAKENLTITLFDLRDKVLSSFRKQDVQSLELVRDGQDIVCEKRQVGDKEEWRLLKPLDWRANSDAVEDILLEFEDLKVLEFVADSPANLSGYGLDPPVATVTLTLAKAASDAAAQQEKTTLLLGFVKQDPQEAGKRYVYVMKQGSSTVVLVKDKAFEQVRKPLSQLQDKTILSFDSWSARELTISVGEQTLRLNKPEGGLWKMTEPLQGDCNDSSVNDILYAIDDLKATRFVQQDPTDLAPYGLDKPQIEVTVGLKGTSDKEALVNQTLLVGALKPSGEASGQEEASQEAGVYVMPKGGAWVCLAAPSLVGDLTIKPSDLLQEKTSP